jgi:hypothetical protein
MVSFGHKKIISRSSEKNFLPSIATADNFQKQCDPPGEKEDLRMTQRLNLTMVI